MNWKEFFKPNVIKIIITIILFFLGHYLIAPVHMVDISQFKCRAIEPPSYSVLWEGCGISGYMSVGEYMKTALIISLNPHYFFMYDRFSIPYNILGLIYYYLLSCLIVLGYKSIFKNKKFFPSDKQKT